MLQQPRDRRSFPRWSEVDDEQWNDWRWQLKNRVSTLEELRGVVELTEDEERAVRSSDDLLRLGITPHFATLIDPRDARCPMRLQAVPQCGELNVRSYETSDPLHEDVDSPVPGVTHRYPDRVLFLITHECALFCRYCTRRRIVGDHEGTSTDQIESALDYVRRTPAVRDVLISGGDPLAVSDRRLEYVLSQLRRMEHVEVIRIGTRMPVVMPQRITREFVAMLRRYHPVWLNTHFNHPFELSPAATREAMERLIDAGVPTGNQTVLLRGINDCPVVMKRLVHELVKVRCRPYYLYNCDLAEGLSHFRTTVAKGVAILEALWGHTSGYAVPTFVVDAPGGKGKIPLLPSYVISQGDGRVVLRNYKGEVAVYHEGGTPDDEAAPATCQTCGTDHGSIDTGVARELWSNARP